MDLLKPKLPDNCSRGALDAFDLTYSDDNADWTLCNLPSWSSSSNDDDLPQVRAMVDATSPGPMALLVRKLGSMSPSSLILKGHRCMCIQLGLQK